MYIFNISIYLYLYLYLDFMAVKIAHFFEIESTELLHQCSMSRLWDCFVSLVLLGGYWWLQGVAIEPTKMGEYKNQLTWLHGDYWTNGGLNQQNCWLIIDLG